MHKSLNFTFFATKEAFVFSRSLATILGPFYDELLKKRKSI
jgi:hypothetical protein